MLIGIDGSTVKTGFSFGGVSDGAPKGGVWKMPGADDLVFDRTLAGISESLSLLVRTVGAEYVYIERFITPEEGSNHHTIVSLIQLAGAMRAAATRAGAKVRLVGVNQVRRHFIGTGNLPGPKAKRAVQDRCRLLGWTYQDDNHADSIAVWSYGMSLHYPKWAPRSTPLFAERKAS